MKPQLPSPELVDQLVLHFNAFKTVATFSEMVEMAEEAIKLKEETYGRERIT